MDGDVRIGLNKLASLFVMLSFAYLTSSACCALEMIFEDKVDEEEKGECDIDLNHYVDLDKIAALDKDGRKRLLERLQCVINLAVDR